MSSFRRRSSPVSSQREEQQSEHLEDPHAPSLFKEPALVPALEATKLSFCYPNGSFALKELTFSIAQGERIGLIGPSGAGKSTLLLHFNGLLPEELPTQKQIQREEQHFANERIPLKVLGLPMVKDRLKEIRHRVGMVFQNPEDQLFCSTVQEDVAFGPLQQGLSRSDIQERLQQALEDVGMSGVEGRRIQELSFGEKKRISLAGILACQPDLLVLDEPFSNLDPRARRNLLAILQGISQTQLIATHDLDVVLQLCSRVILLDEGEIQAVGSTERILSDSMLMERHGLEVPLRWQIKLLRSESQQD